jgi:peptidoglycan/LPS O-acetylase OafA/YrhL
MSEGVSPIESRQNAIGFLRLLLASLVIYYHCFPLSGLAPPAHSAMYELSRLAVPGFFFLSGMLITRSFLGSANWKHFLWNRVLRIFPGYWVCLFICAFGFALLACAHDFGTASALFRPGFEGPYSYLAKNALLVQKQSSIAGAFGHNPYPFAINGSLWTLINEFACYLIVCLLGVAGLLAKRREVVLGLVALLFAVYLTPAATVEPHLPAHLAEYLYRYQLLHQGLYFGIGGLAWLYRDKVRLRVRWALLSLIAWGFVFETGGAFGRLIVPLAVSYMLLWLAFRARPVFNFDLKRDLSYGIYIYAFPVQQTLALFGLYRLGVWPYFSLTLLAAMPFAWLSWTLVEKRAIALKKWRPRLSVLRGTGLEPARP